MTVGALPDHDAETLVRTLLDVFAAASDTNAPAEALFGVASGRFAGSLGSVEHLADVLRNPVWAPLLRHAASSLHTSERLGDAVRIHVDVVPSDGAHVTSYLVSLRVVTIENAARWRVTGLVPAHRLDV